jgi:hypothetical protein
MDDGPRCSAHLLHVVAVLLHPHDAAFVIELEDDLLAQLLVVTDASEDVPFDVLQLRDPLDRIVRWGGDDGYATLPSDDRGLAPEGPTSLLGFSKVNGVIMARAQAGASGLFSSTSCTASIPNWKVIVM